MNFQHSAMLDCAASNSSPEYAVQLATHTLEPQALAVSLRLQLTDTAEYKDRSPYQAFAEYLLCCVVLFLAVLNFMG